MKRKEKEKEEIDITSVYVVNYGNDLLVEYQVSLNNEELSNLSKIVAFPTEDSNIPKYDSQELSTSRKYFISGDKDNEYYQLHILKDILSNTEAAPTLKSIDDIFDEEGKLSCNVAVYISKKDNGDEELFVYELSSVNLVKDKGFWIFKKKVGTSDNNEAKVEQIENGFSLPTNKLIASLYQRKDIKQGKQYKATIYQAYDFDEVFNTKKTQYEYVKNTLRKFSDSKDPIKLTSNEIKVIWKEDKNNEIMDVICQDEYLTKIFANFHDSKKRIIKKIGKDKLKAVLKTLTDYVKDNSDANFGLENIPELTKEDNLKITEKSVPTFATLLDNKVIERLLNKEIVIPYYKRHPRQITKKI